MVSIRLARYGAHKRPYYRIEVADRRRTPGGRCIERVGFYNPKAAANEEKFRIDAERVRYWLDRGARPSERVADLLKKAARA
jgi:small subunit ribosomal protein S16